MTDRLYKNHFRFYSTIVRISCCSKILSLILPSTTLHHFQNGCDIFSVSGKWKRKIHFVSHSLRTPSLPSNGERRKKRTSKNQNNGKNKASSRFPFLSQYFIECVLCVVCNSASYYYDVAPFPSLRMFSVTNIEVKNNLSGTWDTSDWYTQIASKNIFISNSISEQTSNAHTHNKHAIQ